MEINRTINGVVYPISLTQVEKVIFNLTDNVFRHGGPVTRISLCYPGSS